MPITIAIDGAPLVWMNIDIKKVEVSNEEGISAKLDLSREAATKLAELLNDALRFSSRGFMILQNPDVRGPPPDPFRAFDGKDKDRALSEIRSAWRALPKFPNVERKR